MRRISFVLLLMALAGGFAGACHRRRPRDGTCIAHIDCDPGYDCLARRCRKRAAAPGLTPEPPPRPTSPSEVPPPAEVPPTSWPPPAEVPAPPRPAPQRPRPDPAPSSPIDNTPTPPPPDLPAWKARLKDS